MLLFRKSLSASLKIQGFDINPYNWCVANLDINGSQYTIIWHVDDLKISHKDSAAVDKIIASLKLEYRKVGEMTVRRGKKLLFWKVKYLVTQNVCHVWITYQ